MPSTSTSSSPDDQDHTGSDLFTRLFIRSCTDDDGIRPAACPIWYRSPAIQFVPDPPLTQGQPAVIRITIDNSGTMDATTAWLEVTYNVWLDNGPQGNVPIATVALPVIPAGGQYTADVPWTPPTQESAHACVHARVMDVYSMVSNPAAWSWDPLVNPAVANHNVTLVVVEDPTKPLVVRFPVRNFERQRQTLTLLVTRHDAHALVRREPADDAPTALDHEYPLPFLPDRIRAAARARVVGAAGALLEAAQRRTFFPRRKIHPAFVHGRFGFDDQEPSIRPGAPTQRSGHVDELGGRSFASLRQYRLEPEQEGHVELVIPPGQLPAPGRRARFELRVQRGAAAPVVHHVYVTR